MVPFEFFCGVIILKRFLFSTFLPQDRVTEFARMSPQQLLRETQRAAGDENLINWHDTLIKAGKESKTLQLVCRLVFFCNPLTVA